MINKITTKEEKLIRKGICPDCKKKGFLAGPEGGGSQNFRCANPECGSKFNDMDLFGIERINSPSPSHQPNLMRIVRDYFRKIHAK